MSRDTERDFLAAHRRISVHAPLHPKLQERAVAGTLKLNISTLALEAGHSRTLIGTRDTKFPRVRALIFPNEEMIPGQEADPRPLSLPEPTNQEVLSNLRKEKKLMKMERDSLATRLAESEMALALCLKENATLKATNIRLEMGAETTIDMKP